MIDNRDFLSNKKIDIVQFFPEYIRTNSDDDSILKLLNVFQLFLNTLYQTESIYIEQSVVFSNDEQHLSFSCSDSYTELVEISVLEKIYRIIDSIDPFMTDNDNFNNIADLLGFTLLFGINDIDNSIFSNNIEFSSISRNILRELPAMYTQKTNALTFDNFLKLISFSGNLYQGYTLDYNTDAKKWIFAKVTVDNNTISDDLSNIPGTYYPTSHIKIAADIDMIDSNNFDDVISNFQKIGNIIKSIKPVTTVFRGITIFGDTNVSYGVSVCSFINRNENTKLIIDPSIFNNPIWNNTNNTANVKYHNTNNTLNNKVYTTNQIL